MQKSLPGGSNAHLSQTEMSVSPSEPASIVRRAVFGERSKVACPALTGGAALAQQAELRAQSVHRVGEREHHLVLLFHVALQPGETLFQPVNAFAGHEAGCVGSWRP